MNIKQKIWRKIKEIRLSKYLTQEELAQKTQIDITYLSAVERGIKNISIENIENSISLMN